MIRILCALLAMVLSCSPSTAQSIREVDGLTALIEAPDLAGQRVKIPDVLIGHATLGYANGYIEGGTITLTQPWVDRTDFRWLVPKCGELLDVAACRMTIVGDLTFEYGAVSMTNVDFVLPDLDAAFDRDCRRACVGTRSEAFCERYCECTMSELKAANLFDPLNSEQLGKALEAKVKPITAQCSVAVDDQLPKASD